MGFFDRIREITFDIVAKVYGTTATWAPLSGDEPQSEEVLFNDPSKEDHVSKTRFFPFDYEMEYRVGQFPGLLESVRAGAKGEPITINSEDYVCTKATTKWDGKTIYICLKKK